MCLCYIHEPWMSLRVFLSDWIFRHEYIPWKLHGYFNPGIHQSIITFSEDVVPDEHFLYVSKIFVCIPGIRKLPTSG